MQAEACRETLRSQAHHARTLFEQAPADASAQSLLLDQLNQLLVAGKKFLVSLDSINRGLDQRVEAASVPM